MGRRSPVMHLLAATAAAAVLVVAPACGGEADEAVEGAESVATQATSAIPDVTGGDDTTATTAAPPAGAEQELEIPAAETGLAFAVEEATAEAGTITLRMPNPSALPHNIAVDEPEQAIGEVVQQNGVSEITVDFPAGEYEYYCSVPGHREGGMVGTLTVE